LGSLKSGGVAGLHLFRWLKDIPLDVSQDRTSPRIKESSEVTIPGGVGHDLGRNEVILKRGFEVRVELLEVAQIGLGRSFADCDVEISRDQRAVDDAIDELDG